MYKSMHVAILFIMMLVIQPTAPAHALSCMILPLSEETIKNTAVIFEGRVEKARLRDAPFQLWNAAQGKKLYRYKVIQPWKSGIEEGKILSIVQGIAWGESTLEGKTYLLLLPNKPWGGYSLSGVCGDPQTVQHYKDEGTYQELEKTLGIGKDIKIQGEDRACEKTEDCTSISTHCGGCDCGTPVAVKAAQKHKDKLANTCSIASVRARCEMKCGPVMPSCQDGLCQ